MPEEEGDEGRRGEHDGEDALQGGAGDPDQGGEEQGEPHRAKAPQDAQDLGRLPVVDIDPGERREGDVAGQDEEHARERTGPVARLLEPDVDRELERLRAGQDVAEVEGADEFVLADPLAALHQLEVHEADLSDGTSEGEPAQPQEVPEDLAHRDGLGVRGLHLDGRHDPLVHAHLAPSRVAV